MLAEPEVVEPSAHPAADAATDVRPVVADELRQVSREMPDACERLEYVGKMTEKAANTVLASIDAAKPACEQLIKRGEDLAAVMRRQADLPELNLERARALMKLCADYVDNTTRFARQQNDCLTDIMMAQDFQDLSGQVIKKVTDILLRAESELRHIVEDELPGGWGEAAPQALAGVQTPDRALKQDDVDDLLADFGF